jgi:hypothetical protein
MGTAALPSGKRVLLPRKISTIWTVLRVVMALFAETTTTISARAVMQLKPRMSSKAAHECHL